MHKLVTESNVTWLVPAVGQETTGDRTAQDDQTEMDDFLKNSSKHKN